MLRNNVCLVCYLDQDNLGVGYLASSLLETGCIDIILVDMREKLTEIIKGIINSRPLIVGFSIVFQAQLDAFQELILTLRENGVHCHFTAGGHYPSLRYEELMQLIPELDSVVLFEGEHTIVELAKAIQKDLEWRGIDGIVYRINGKIKRNALRPLENDLDRFPLPIRRPVKPMILGRKVINLLAGRGCNYKCSFCSIQRFYSQPPGKVKRIRRPECVAREIQLHYEQESCTIFLFQDDDFPILVSNGYDWIEEFYRQLYKRNLANNIMWKISCRVNEVNEEVFSKLMSCGLGMVYLGIESGTIESLQSMNKRITPEDSLAAARILKRIYLPFEFGFMMFEPFTTFDSLQRNVDFLLQLCGDGSASVGLARMLALAGTEIEDTLRSQNRLFGRPPFEDYKFLDPRLDECYTKLSSIFSAWMHDESGFMNYSRWVHLQLEAFRRFSTDTGEATRARKALQQIVSSANQYLLNTVVLVADLVRSESNFFDAFTKIGSITTEKHYKFCTQLTTLAKHVDKLAGVKIS
jgi:anaerobic magnesium-protoporphyrin IX monomethyl ester cyclase